MTRQISSRQGKPSQLHDPNPSSSDTDDDDYDPTRETVSEDEDVLEEDMFNGKRKRGEEQEEEEEEKAEERKRRVEALWAMMNQNNVPSTSSHVPSVDDKEGKVPSTMSVKGPPRRTKSSLADRAAALSGRRKGSSTLERSRLQWIMHAETSGIRDALEHHNKDGYIERQSFLQRAETRRHDQLKDQTKDGSRSK
ncbi:hypothetical protein BJ684DRAFT_19297 [Piptocephalis cylindrospora]|uniref:SWR1-complex protein 5 n=1 Tax=Piptocephalis cylindrospora TaxID=1907219 RepID=A0A4P9Y5S6_9FUNG|nr:hypothetical protein BJ684DRAFT_19297 [Piptocephalis cylindrospora]|eukprot:RKP14285.1 hypothetical protein BJ684DRAFT_19297 [Piptocephalis cylindrospora]